MNPIELGLLEQIAIYQSSPEPTSWEKMEGIRQYLKSNSQYFFETNLHPDLQMAVRTMAPELIKIGKLVSIEPIMEEA